MYLKRLELAGFKTFADRTDLEFHPGITAIVGPNGSGKSNLSDAIRWSLGEQSAHALRGIRTEDFIFAGSAKRRPHGLAQVTLTLDNAEGSLPLEFSEVSVARRATRGGEGEFFLNGASCRLRDIQMLFLGTGLGGRSYALIGQGEVDAVLNASPQERRLLLEEAAGLARYKRRRLEALRRLEQTATHLQRVADLVGELETQHARLADQAEAARRYRACTEEMETIELAVIADEARRLRQAQQRYGQQAESARARLQELQQQAETVRAEVVALQRDREDLARTWENRQRELVELVRTQAAAESVVDRAESEAAAQHREHERLGAEKTQIAADLERAEAERGALRAGREHLEQEVAGIRRDLDTRLQALQGEELTIAAQRAEEEAAAARHARLLASRQEIAGRTAASEAQRDLLARQQTALLERRRRLEEEIAAITAEETRLRERVAEARAALERQRAQQEAAATRLREQSAAQATLVEELRAADARRHRLESRLQVMEEAGAHFLGYEEGARTLLLAKQADPQRFASILGALVDQIEVAPRFRPAVEAALGRRLFCLLVTGTDVLRDALTCVRNDGRGPVSFLPLDRLAGRHPSAPLQDTAGILGNAAGFVSAETQARTAVDALLGDVVVVEDLDVALRLLTAGHRGRAVTLAGELVSPDGVITVRGDGNGHGSALARKMDIAEARPDLQSALIALAHLRERQEVLEREAQACRGESAAREQERLQCERALAEAEAALTAAGRSRARLPGELDAAKAEDEAVARTSCEAEERRERLLAEGLALDGAVRDADDRLVELRQSLASRGAALDEGRRRVEEARVHLASLEAQRQAHSARESDFAAARDALAMRLERLAGEESVLAAAVNRLAESLAVARRDRERLSTQQAELQTELARLEQERAKRDEAFAAAQETVARVEEEAHASEAALHRTEVRAAQADAEWGAVERRLDEVGLTWEAAEHLRLPLPREEARGRLQELRHQVEGLGAVNLRAIEEQEALAARLARLSRQVADIEGARMALSELVQRLDAILRVQFRETFEAVSEEFGRLFFRLFEGGAGHLELVQETPEEDPGLDVVVRLPGKPARTLAALSGGERVLVALALLFAMLRVHPSPFCVFDEVEAALDDANTRRFTTLLGDLAQSTQIIIITHNKGTMEIADILYGVTMQEPGVSSVLSVRLGERAPRGNGASPTAAPAHAGR